MNKIIFKSLTLLLLVLAVSCNKNRIEPDPKPEVEENANLASVGFTLADNPLLGQSVYSYNVGEYFYLSVPESANLKALKANFSVATGSKVYIKDVEQVSGVTVSDFSDIVTVKVVSSTGKYTKSYFVYAKYGNMDIDKRVYKFMTDYSIPGVSISVMKDEKIIYSSGYGFSIEESRTKTSADHLYRLASVSKQFTTLCIMTLYERGLLNIDSNVFGEGGILDKQFPGVTGEKATVTVRNLLQHNSGWPTSPDPMFSSIRDGKTLDDLINYVLGLELSHAPGSTYSYYNMGFGILGRVVEVVSGKEYEKFLKEDVLKPMGITDIHVGGGQDERRSNECVYYSQDGTNGYGNPMRVIAAAGGIIASTNQLMKVLAHIDGRSGVADILKPETLELMYNSPTSNYARYSLGWRIGHNLYPGAHYHSGNLAGTTAIWVGNTNSGMSAALLCNSRSYISGYDDAYYILMGEIIDFFE
ncbi:MAG: serine hydrolase [Bacteroidales bacterium]|nr:serine hydrolase [Bacteroidales bacterium]MDD4671024.1 serine hydrolase [Bacteroidales bacterium]